MMERMRTAEEMLAFIKEKDTGSILGKSKSLEYLKLIEADLDDDEYAVLAFVADHRDSSFEHEGDFANVVTNKRMIMAKKAPETVFKRIPLAEFHSLTVSWGKAFASMTFDASAAQVSMENTISRVKTIQALLKEAIQNLDEVDIDDAPCRSERFVLPVGAAKLRTAEGMLKYCEEKYAGLAVKGDKALGYFRIIEECLAEEEYVLCAFTARQYNLHENSFAVAISNRRILLGRQEFAAGRLLRFAAFDEFEKISVLFGRDTARIKILATKMEMDMEAAVAAGEFMEHMFADILTEPEPEKIETEKPVKLERMKTAEEMLAFIKEKDTGSILGKSKSLEYLKLIEADLDDDEYAVLAFVADHRDSSFEHEGDFANVVTNKRMIMAKKAPETVFKRIPLAEFHSLTVSWGKTSASMTFDASAAQISMENTVSRVKTIQALLKEAIQNLNGVDTDDAPCRSERFVLPEGATKLRTAEGMLKYCEEKGAGLAVKRDKALGYFRIIEECLAEEEYVLCAFTARQYNLHENSFAVAISNRRILLGRQEFAAGRLLRFAAFDEFEKISVLFGRDTARIKILATKMEMDMEAAVAAGKFMENMFADILTEPEPEESVKLERMETAEEMLQYCVDNNTIEGKWPKLKDSYVDFKMIENCLGKGEYVLTCFVGEYSETSFKAMRAGGYVTISDKYEKWACAFSNKRIIMAQQYRWPVRLRSIPYKRLNDIFVGISDSFGNAIISTSNCDLDIRLYCGYKFIREQLNAIQNKVCKAKRELAVQFDGTFRYSVADEIRKYKELCDDGIITEEEFEKQKIDLLNLPYISIVQTEINDDVIIED